jgi:multiple sugar transport system substrate-binding protein
VAAFQWVYDYCAEQGPQDLFAFAGPGDLPGFPPQENYFTVGTLAMMITGDWHLRQMELYNPDLDYGVTYIPVPAEGDQPSTWAGGWSWIIPQGAQQPEAAYQFMSYLAGEPGQRTYTVETAHLPTIEALVTQADLYDEGHRFFAETLLPIAKNRPPLPVGALYWDELTKAWQATYLNEEEPQAALDAAAETVNGELERFCE